MAGAIEIIATPQGEAPLWVREAWIGMVLPLAGEQSYGEWRVVGVLTGPRTCLGLVFSRLRGRTRLQTGYLVWSGEAICLLERHHPEAARWWRMHTSYATPGAPGFIFDAPACRPIG